MDALSKETLLERKAQHERDLAAQKQARQNCQREIENQQQLDAKARDYVIAINAALQETNYWLERVDLVVHVVTDPEKALNWMKEPTE